MEYFFGFLVLIVIIFVMMGVTVVQQGFVYTIERFGRFTHAAQPGGDHEAMAQVSAEARAAERGQRFVRALQDPLRPVDR